VLALEENVDFEYVAIREGLPKLFYEIIQKLILERKLIKIARNFKLPVENIIFGILSNPLSSDNENFSNLERLDSVRNSDEFKTWNFLRQSFALHLTGDDSVYLPRPRIESRGLANNTFIEQKFIMSGGLIVRTSNLSLEDLLSTLNRVSIFCTTDGASMINMLFIRDQSTVVEIHPFHKAGWKNITTALGLNHISIRCKSVVPGRIKTTIDTYYVPRSSISKLLKSYESRFVRIQVRNKY